MRLNTKKPLSHVHHQLHIPPPTKTSPQHRKQAIKKPKNISLKVCGDTTSRLKMTKGMLTMTAPNGPMGPAGIEHTPHQSLENRRSVAAATAIP